MGQQGPVNPPDGWIVTNGVWGTDIVQDTAQTLSSPTSLKVPAGHAVTIVGPWTQVNTYSALNGSGMRYQGRAFLYGDNVGNSVTHINMVFYAANQSTVNSTVTLFTGVTTPANQWIAGTGVYQTSAADVWCRFEITVPNNGHNVWFGGVELIRLAPTFLLESINASIAGVVPSTWTAVGWNGVTLGEVDLANPTIGTGTRTGIFLKSNGTWSFDVDVSCISNNMTNGTIVQIRVVDGVGGGVLVGPVAFGYHDNPTAIDFLWPFLYNVAGNGSAGYPYVLEIWHNDAANRDFTAAFQGVFNR